jgi:glutaredoxin
MAFAPARPPVRSWHVGAPVAAAAALVGIWCLVRPDTELRERTIVPLLPTPPAPVTTAAGPEEGATATAPVRATRAAETLPPTDPATDARLRALLAMLAAADAGPPAEPSPARAPSPSPSAHPAGSAQPAEETAPDLADATSTAPHHGAAHVVVYSTSWCPACRKAKAWLKANGVPYEDRDIEASRTYAMQMRALNPRMSIPTIDVEGDVSVGFSAEWLEVALERHGAGLR